MEKSSRLVAGVVLVTVPTIAFGGMSLLWMLKTTQPGYLDNPLRQDLFRAGHAHAGVWVILALVALLYVDRARLSEGMRWLVRICLVTAPILGPAGFFFSVLPPDATEPGPALALVYVAAAALAVGTVTLGVGLLRSAKERK